LSPSQNLKASHIQSPDLFPYYFLNAPTYAYHFGALPVILSFGSGKEPYFIMNLVISVYIRRTDILTPDEFFLHSGIYLYCSLLERRISLESQLIPANLNIYDVGNNILCLRARYYLD
jgi:hypothetical protein